MLDVHDQPQNVRQLVETGRERIGQINKIIGTDTVVINDYKE